MSKQVLLAVYLDTHFTELIRVARMLQRSGEYVPVIFFARTYSAIERDLAVCRAEDISCLDAGGHPVVWSRQAQPSAPSKPVIGGRSVLRRHIQRLIGNSPGVLRQFFFRSGRYALEMMRNNLVFCLLKYWRQIKSARQLFRRQRPDILILTEDNVGYGTAVLIKAAHELGVPSVIVPYTVANALEPAEAFFQNPAHNLKKWTNRFVGARYPRWVYEHKGRKLLRLPASRVLAMEWMGLAPPLPWIVNSGYADAIAVESDFMYQYYRQEGLPANRLVPTGALYDDVLAENLQAAATRRVALCQKLGVPVELPMILCALPPSQFGIGRLECDFVTYEELVQFWVQSLSHIEGYNIVVRLHPRLKYEDMKYLEQWGVRIAQEDTATLIPLCDVFVASVSATIRWAIACGKPVVNYDVYRLRYTEYIDAGGVLTVEGKGEFVSTLRRLTRDQVFYDSVAARQTACMRRWGRFDGHAADRMLQLFSRLTEEGTSPWM